MTATLSIEPDDVIRALFFGLGADGTVGANKNSIKIIGEETDNFAQGYFVYDSKKSGAITVSHLRFGPRPIRSAYLVDGASFVGCHQFVFLDKYEMLENARPGAVFLLNSPFGPETVWDELPFEVQQQIIEKKLRFFVIDAYQVAKDTGMGTRINTVMQTCFFAISGVLPREQAIAEIKKAIEKTYGKRGPDVVRKNFAAVDETLRHLYEVPVPATVSASRQRPPLVADAAPDFVKRVTAVMLANKGDLLPVSRLPRRRHLAHGHGTVGETEHRARNPGVGRGAVHPMQQVRARVPPCGHPREGVPARRARGAAGQLQERAVQGERIQRGDAVHHSGRAGGLHRVHALRDGLPRQGQDEPEAPRHRHGAAAAAAGAGSRELRVLPGPPRGRSLAR